MSYIEPTLYAYMIVFEYRHNIILRFHDEYGLPYISTEGEAGEDWNAWFKSKEYDEWMNLNRGEDEV
jgi:hypothetical protein